MLIIRIFRLDSQNTVRGMAPAGSKGSVRAAELAIDRFQRDKSDPSVIVFNETKRCQLPHSTQFFQKAIFPAEEARSGLVAAGAIEVPR